MASLKRRSSTPDELQPGSHMRRDGRQVLGDLSSPALAGLLNFLEWPAEISTLDGEVVYANERLERVFLLRRHDGCHTIRPFSAKASSAHGLSPITPAYR